MSVSPMHRALLLAQARQGFCAPNPSVGAVIIDAKGEVVGEGAHWQAGEDHAEVVALKQAGAFSLGASLYVTLVPCHHHGKTPPCTDAIIEAGIREVYYAYEDPSELVQTHTSRFLLEAAGIHVHFTPMKEITQFYRAYHHWCHHQQPWIDVKLVHSENGAIAQPQGKPIALSGASFNQWVHRQRYHHDAMLTTVKTVIHDNPQLNARLDGHVTSKPVFVLDRTLKMPLDAKVWHTASKIYIFYDQSIPMSHHVLTLLQEKGAVLLPVPCQVGQLSWLAILDKIGSLGFHSLWVEMGAMATQSLINSHLWRRFLLVKTPKTVDQGYDGQIHILHKSCSTLVPHRWMLDQDQITEWVR